MPVHPDYIATTAFDSRALEAMMLHLTGHHDKSMIRSLWPRTAIDRARQQDVEPVRASRPFMNDDSQAGNMAIIGIVAPAVQLHQLRCVAGRVVG
jgi:hypothetical protein